jgi:integrase
MSHENKSLQIRKLLTQNGEYLPYLTLDGIPLILPNLWVDSLSKITRGNTQEAYLRDVSILYGWAIKNKISIEDRIASFKGFRRRELEKIAHELCTTSKGENASAATCSRRSESIKNFLNFAFDSYIEHLNVSLETQTQAEKNKERQSKRLGKLIFAKRSTSPDEVVSTDLNKKELTILKNIASPSSKDNPFKSESVKIRNNCILHVLLETLARRGELVLLEITDVELGSKPTITIKPPSQSTKNKRKDGASLKTLGRTVPISQSLAELLKDYIENTRDSFLVTKRPSTSLFLGKKDGRRLSAYSLNSIFSSLAHECTKAGLNSRVHPHGIRTTAANNIRRALSKNQELSDREIEEMLSYLGGWTSNSQMPRKYTRTAMAERAARILYNY